MLSATRGVLEVKVSRSARNDLTDIDDYGVEEFGDEVASEYSRGLAEALELLGRHPHAGQSRPDFGKNVRCKVHRQHRILYRVTDDTVFVERILHHSRDVPRHLPT